MAEAKKFIETKFSQFDTDSKDQNIINIKYLDEQDYVAFVLLSLYTYLTLREYFGCKLVCNFRAVESAT